MTGLDYIKDAFALIGVYSPGQDIPSGRADNALRQANRMLEGWSAKLSGVFSETQDSLALVSGTASYIIGPGGTPTTTKPLNLLEAHVRGSDLIDHPLRPIPFREYQDISFKTTQSDFPQYIAWNPTNPNVTIYLWPIPTSGLTLYITSQKVLASMTLAGEYAAPAGYSDAIVWNLAILLAPVYGRQDAIGNMNDHASIAGQAAEMYKQVLISNMSVAGVGLDPMLPTNGNYVVRDWRSDI